MCGGISWRKCISFKPLNTHIPNKAWVSQIIRIPYLDWILCLYTALVWCQGFYTHIFYKDITDFFYCTLSGALGDILSDLKSDVVVLFLKNSFVFCFLLIITSELWVSFQKPQVLLTADILIITSTFPCASFYLSLALFCLLLSHWSDNSHNTWRVLGSLHNFLKFWNKAAYK